MQFSSCSTCLHAGSTDDRPMHPFGPADGHSALRLGRISPLADRVRAVGECRGRGALLRLVSVTEHAARRARWYRPRGRSDHLCVGLHQPDRAVEPASQAAHSDGAGQHAGAQACARRCARAAFRGRRRSRAAPVI